MMLTENRINKLLDHVWKSSHVFESSFYIKKKFSGIVWIGEGFGKKGIPHKVIRNRLVRVYKKYHYNTKKI